MFAIGHGRFVQRTFSDARFRLHQLQFVGFKDHLKAVVEAEIIRSWNVDDFVLFLSFLERVEAQGAARVDPAR